MEEALKNLGIEGSALLAQTINFGILLFVLWKFLYKPILKVLDDRANKVEESIKNTEKIEKALAKSEKDKEVFILEAKKEADQIVKEAKKNAKEVEKNILEKAENKAKEIIDSAKKDAKNEKEAVVATAKKEIAQLVEDSLNKILADSEKYDDSLINEAITEYVKK